MKEKLDKIRENALLEINSWWGLGEAGYDGTIITKDKKIINYNFFYHLTPFLEENNIPLESISEGKTISEDNYSKIVKFIEEEIINKEFTENHIFDASYIVRGNYNNAKFNIVNDMDLYNKVGQLIKDIKEGN